jgi:hypothetical protein
MSDLQSFNEWVKGRPAKPKTPSVKNPAIDAFLKSVDGLKRDMDELDAVEKKKPKVKPGGDKPDDKKKKEKEIDTFKDYKKKRDSEDEENTDDEGDEEEPAKRVDGDGVSVRPQSRRNNPDKPLRLPPDRKVQGVPERQRAKPDSPFSSRRKRLEN